MISIDEVFRLMRSTGVEPEDSREAAELSQSPCFQSLKASWPLRTELSKNAFCSVIFKAGKLYERLNREVRVVGVEK